MKRGDVVTVALPGDYGKPRPAVIVQADFFFEHPSFVVVPITSEIRNAPLFRIGIEPDPGNGLRVASQLMVDKLHAVARGRIGQVVGRLEDDQLLALNRSMAVFLGIV